MSRPWLNRTQMDIVQQFEAGDFGEVEFFERALEAGMDIGAIGEVLAEMRVEMEIAGEGTLK